MSNTQTTVRTPFPILGYTDDPHVDLSRITPEPMAIIPKTTLVARVYNDMRFYGIQGMTRRVWVPSVSTILGDEKKEYWAAWRNRSPENAAKARTSTTFGNHLHRILEDVMEEYKNYHDQRLFLKYIHDRLDSDTKRDMSRYLVNSPHYADAIRHSFEIVRKSKPTNASNWANNMITHLANFSPMLSLAHIEHQEVPCADIGVFAGGRADGVGCFPFDMKWLGQQCKYDSLQYSPAKGGSQKEPFVVFDYKNITSMDMAHFGNERVAKYFCQAAAYGNILRSMGAVDPDRPIALCLLMFKRFEVNDNTFHGRTLISLPPEMSNMSSSLSRFDIPALGNTIEIDNNYTKRIYSFSTGIGIGEHSSEAYYKRFCDARSRFAVKHQDVIMKANEVLG